MTRLINPCANERQPLRIKNQDALLGKIRRLRKQVHQLQLVRDILTKANELIKRSGRQLSETEKQGENPDS